MVRESMSARLGGWACEELRGRRGVEQRGNREFRQPSQALNNESTLLVLDRLFGATMGSVFREDLRFSREVLLPSFRRRAWSKRVMERAARLLGPVL